MHASLSARCFSGTYAEARSKFLAAAGRAGATLESFEMEQHRGALGEPLAMDVARLGPADASQLLVLSSGTHGPEGFAGSACQLALLQDEDLLTRMAQARVGLLLVHGVNPYGFSWLHRTNEDNIDLNRNFIDFKAPLPVNAGYAELEPLLLPAQWPPTAQNAADIAAFREKHGARQVAGMLSGGQYHSPNGLFYGGQAASWSNRTIRAVLRKYAAAAKCIGWIDVHTGLGPYGHGEKIYPGRIEDAPLARSWWGADVMVIAEKQSLAPGATGPMMRSAHEECPRARIALMGLEFGTLPQEEVQNALRADAWMRGRKELPAAVRDGIRQQLRDVFYCDNDEWKGMVLAQSRVILLQTITGMRAAQPATA